MEHRLAVLGLYLTVVACADTGEQARPVFSASNEVARTIAYDPYGEGKQNLAAGQYGLAIERFMAAYRRDPYDVGVLNALGITYDSLGRRDLARRYLERALALDPSSPVTLNNLGRCWMNDGNWQIAVTYLQRAQALDGKNGQIASNLKTANGRVEAARTPSAEMASRTAPELWIERATPSTQVLHTRPELPFLDLGETIGGSRQSAMGTSAPTFGSLVPADDNESSVSADTPFGGKVVAAPASLAIVNGTGRRGMAARFRSHLASQSIFAGSLMNASSYTHRKTVIFYRRDREYEAEKLAAALPLPVALIRSDLVAPDLRLRLGSDLLDFDTGMLATSDETGGLLS